MAQELAIFLLLFFVILAVCAVLILLLVSGLSGESISSTVRSLWHTYFGRGDNDLEK